MYKQAKKGLAKFIARRGQSTDGPAIKLEGAFMAEQNNLLEESFLSRGWSKPGRKEENLKKLRNTILAVTDKDVTNEESYIIDYLNETMM